MKKVAIIGDGYVGQAMGRLFSLRYETKVYGKGWNPKKVNAADLKVICVPTPSREDGSCDTSIVEDVVSKLTGLVLIKSTIPPGVTEALNLMYPEATLCFSPEYIGESTYHVPERYLHPTDASLHYFVIVGGKEPIAQEIVQFFLPIMGPHVKYHICSSTEAEMVKYMENVTGAMKVTLFNLYCDICDALGISYERVRELFLLDGRTEPMHTAVFRDKRGFGGKCFPKDLSALILKAESLGVDVSLLREVVATNKRMLEKNETP